MRNVFIALLTMIGLLLLARCGGKSTPAPKPAPPNVGVSDVTQANVPIYANWVASLDGYVNANIQPQVTGYLIKQDYREGSFVRKNDILFEIDPRPFQAALDQARGQLAQAKGHLGQAQAQLGLAEINVRRDTPLAAAHAIARSQLDNDVQGEKQNQALIRSNQASIEAAEANVEQAELNLGYTKVRSLVNGIAGMATTQVGNLVSPITVLTAVSQVNPIKVYFAISEQEYLSLADRIRTKTSGSTTIDFLGAKNFVPIQLTLANNKVYGHEGRILFADRSVNNQTGTIRIIGAFPNPGNILRPGQFGRIRALTAMNENALLVPQEAVTEVQGRYQVAIVQPDNTIKIVNVQAGDKYQNFWVIQSGLKPGKHVVTEGTSKVRDGERVSLQPNQTKPVSPYGSRGEGAVEMSKFFINRPIVAMVIAILMVLVGVISMLRLPISQFPSIVPPEILVSAIYPGANAQTLEQSVATPLEEQISGVDNMNYMYSINTNNGQTQITVDFDVSTDPNINQVLTQLRTAQAQSQLPSQVNTAGLTIQKSLSSPLLLIALYSPHGTYDSIFLANYGYINLVDQVTRVPGVARVQVFGAGQYAMRCWVNPDRLASTGITVPQIISALNAQNTVNPAGQRGAEPAPNGQQFTYTVQAQGRLTSPEQFGNIILRSNPDGSTLRLKDVARLELGSQTYNLTGRYNGKPSAILAVYQLPGSNAVDAANAVRAEMAQLAQRFPQDLSYQVSLDTTKAVTAGMQEILRTLLQALALVILVVYIFLQGWRATLIPLAAVPVLSSAHLWYFHRRFLDQHTLALRSRTRNRLGGR